MTATIAPPTSPPTLTVVGGESYVRCVMSCVVDVHPDDLKRLKAYLYEHTIVTEVLHGPDRIAVVLRTRYRAARESTAYEGARMLAEGQVLRLRTGLFVCQVCDSYSNAYEMADEYTQKG